MKMGVKMNIQIFGTKKSAETRKADRYFKERGIKVQAVDLKEKGLSKGELNSVIQAVGSLEALIDENTKDQKTYLLIKYLAPEDRFEKVLENPQVLKQPIVRNGHKATVGYQPDVWKTWE
jgi:arsenate reductase-like glutaredoxin family protein